MLPLPLKYNPGLTDDQSLVASFVARRTLLELILETLSENSVASNQHILVVGPRGIGKTTLVTRVAAEVRTNSSFASRWMAIAFPEEAYGVSSPGQFWLEALSRLASDLKSAS